MYVIEKNIGAAARKFKIPYSTVCLWARKARIKENEQHRSITCVRTVDKKNVEAEIDHDGLATSRCQGLATSSSLETPTWRIKSTKPCYSMEGTEDIADLVLLKRHEKMEKAEKQRKRLDMQRMRQEQQLQKLRARQEKQHAAQFKKEEATSLLPSLEAAKHICVEVDTTEITNSGISPPENYSDITVALETNTL